MQPKISNFAKAKEPIVVTLAKAGNHPAFEELVIRYQSWLRNLLRRLSNDSVLADDLTQQAFLQAWKEINKLESNKAFGAWLKSLAVNIWLQHVRRNDPLALLDDSPDGELEPLVAPQRESVSKGLDLDYALAQLQPQVRLCVTLSYNEGMSHKEISELIQSPLGTVKSHINRGSQKLRALLSAYKEV